MKRASGQIKREREAAVEKKERDLKKRKEKLQFFPHDKGTSSKPQRDDCSSSFTTFPVRIVIQKAWAGTLLDWCLGPFQFCSLLSRRFEFLVCYCCLLSLFPFIPGSSMLVQLADPLVRNLGLHGLGLVRIICRFGFRVM